MRYDKYPKERQSIFKRLMDLQYCAINVPFTVVAAAGLIFAADLASTDLPISCRAGVVASTMKISRKTNTYL